MRLIDADALYEKTAEWEARALAVVEKLNSKPLGEMDVNEITEWRKWSCVLNERSAFKHDVADAPTIEPEPPWIPVTERLPEDIKPVIVTWKNTDPESYYQYIVGKHFIGAAHYKSGKWYWYSSVTEDLLAEYGKCDSEEFDEAIEVVAWMPLPKPWEGGDS